MRSQAICNLASWLIIVACTLPLQARAQEPTVVGSEGTAEILGRMERRLDELEQENGAIRAENAQLLGAVENSDFSEHRPLAHRRMCRAKARRFRC